MTYTMPPHFYFLIRLRFGAFFYGVKGVKEQGKRNKEKKRRWGIPATNTSSALSVVAHGPVKMNSSSFRYDHFQPLLLRPGQSKEPGCNGTDDAITGALNPNNTTNAMIV